MAEIDNGGLSFKGSLDNSQINAAIEETLRRIQGYSDAVAGTGDVMDTVTAEIVECVEVQKEVIEELEQAIVELDKSIEAIEPGDGQIKLIEEANAARTELENERKALVDLENELRVLQGTSTVSATSLSQIRQVLGEIGDACEIHEVALRDLGAEYDRLGKEASEAFLSGRDEEYRALSRQQESIGGEITLRKALVKELADQSNALESQAMKIEESRKKAEDAAQAHVSFRTQLQNIREEMVALEQAGQKNTDRYRELEKEAGSLAGTISNVNKQTQILGHNESGFQGVISALSGVSGGFSAATGAISLFAGENDDLQKIMVKVQSLMAITIGLQQVQQTLNEKSAFSLVTLSRAKNLVSAASLRLGAAFVRMGMSATTARIAISALYATLTLGLSLAVSGAIALWGKYSEKQEEAKKRAEELAEATKKQEDRFNDLAKKYSEQVAVIRTYQNMLRSETLSQNEKLKVLNKLKDIIPDYNAKLSKEGDVLWENKKAIDAYMISLERSLKFKAAMEDLTEVYAEMYKLEKFAPPGQNKTIKLDGQDVEVTDWDEIAQRRGAKNASDIPAHILEEWKKADESLSKLSEKLNEEQKKAVQEKIDNIQDYIEKNGLIELDFSKSDKKNKEKVEDPFVKELEERKKKYNEYFQWINNGYQQEAQVEFRALLEHGKSYKDYLQGLLDSGKLTKEQVYKVTNEIVGENNQTMLDTFKKSLEEQMDSAGTVIEQLKAIQKAREELNDPKNQDPLKEEKTEILDQEYKEAEERRKKETSQVLQEYADVYDQRLDLELKYFNDLDLLKKQKETAITNEEKQRIDRAIAYRKTKYDEDVQNLLSATTNANVRMIELARDTTILEISRKNYLFESDKRKDILEAQKLAAEATLEQFQKLQNEAPTEELAHEIAQVTLEIQEMNAELAKMPNEKFQEALSGIKQITSALGGLDGEIGEIFSNISGQIENIKVAFDETASTTDKVSAGIAGIVSVINMLSSASAKRKQVEKEFYQNQIALAHEYALALNDVLRTQSELAGGGFITDYAGKINDGFEALSDATKGYQEALGKLSEGRAKIDLRNAVDWGNVGKGAASGAAAGAAIGSVVPVIGTAIGAVAGAIIGGLAGLFGGKKKKEQYAGLLDVFPELVDGAGNLNKELAQTLINTKQVDDNTRQLIQNALDWSDAMEAANAQIKEVTVELAGDLGVSLKNSIVEAWKAGEDASKSMFDAASKSLEKFVEDLLYSTIFSEVFDEFGERLAKSLSPSGDGDILDDYDWLMDEMNSRDDYFISLLEQVKNRAKERGFSAWGDENAIISDVDKSLTGAVKGVTEETASLLAGQINAIRINQVESTEIIRQQLFHLANISQNTGAIDVNTRYIKAIYDKMSSGGDPLRSKGLGG